MIRPANSRSGGHYCIGGRGTADVHGIPYTGFCGGNNSGYIIGHNAYGTQLTQYFGPSGDDIGSWSGVYEFGGNTARFPGGEFRIDSVTITSFSGPDDCPQ